MVRSPYLLSLLLAGSLAAQSSPAPGFRLFAPFGSLDTYLVDTNDVIVHTWHSDHPPIGAYLEDSGALLRPIYTPYLPNVPNIGGVGGGVQRRAFDGSLKWQYLYASNFGWSHHDVATMPNGNILMIVWDRLTAADAFAMGRNPAYQTSNEWNPCAIIEVQQTGLYTGAIVWEWHFMDHTIQDFDPTAPNFGVVGDHPEKLDINFPPEADLRGEWNHINTIDYDPVNDLIVIGSPYQNEFWIIDHSTTTAEAASNTGGNYGKGGGFLYRWGNPQSYRAGTAADQQLFFHHGANFIDEGLPGAGNT
ncbi:MAG: aryl-sulfate sulfotransferase [Planctomycetes bacterium]|nr:aryl-sulfate sulfotransferase [Planctomycetota bacterium]